MRNFTYSMRTQPDSASDMRFGPTFPHPGCGFCLYSRIRYAVLPIFPHPVCGARIQYAAPASQMWNSNHELCVIYISTHTQTHICSLSLRGVSNSTGPPCPRLPLSHPHSALQGGACSPKNIIVNFQNYRIPYAVPHTVCGYRIQYAGPGRNKCAGYCILYAACRPKPHTVCGSPKTRM